MRDATLDDMPFLLEMAVDFHKASGFKFELDDDAFVDVASNMILNGCLLITKRGMIGALMLPCWLQPEWLFAQELFWWSEDGNGVYLIRGFEKWARANDASEIRVCTMDSFTGADGILTRLGYSKRETAYAKDI